MLDTYVTVDNKSQLFPTPMRQNHITTAPRSDQNMFDQVSLVYDTLLCQKYTTTHMNHQKISPSGKVYLYFRTDERPFRESQCDKSKTLTKVIETVISVVSF